MNTFRLITFPLILPAIVSAFLISFTTSFDEYAVASFVVGTRVTFPLYLYGALRFPSRLPEVLAVAVVVMTVSLLVVIGAEIARRIAERRLGSLSGYRPETTCARDCPWHMSRRGGEGPRQPPWRGPSVRGAADLDLVVE